MTTKLTENEITIQNLREEIEKLTKIQEQQKQQVNQRKKNNKIWLYLFIELNDMSNEKEKKIPSDCI